MDIIRVAFGADHAGFAMKNDLIARLVNHYDVTDLGAFVCNDSDDYPDIVLPVAEAVKSGRSDRGVIICGSGVGACVAANKIPGIRACLCHDVYSAHQGVEHDDMNVLCLGARIIGIELATELVLSFLEVRFQHEERFERRLRKVLDIEQRYSKGVRKATRRAKE